jgi:hypothetical protein
MDNQPATQRSDSAAPEATFSLNEKSYAAKKTPTATTVRDQ